MHAFRAAIRDMASLLQLCLARRDDLSRSGCFVKHTLGSLTDHIAAHAGEQIINKDGFVKMLAKM